MVRPCRSLPHWLCSLRGIATGDAHSRATLFYIRTDHLSVRKPCLSL
jgi:hypothetical protein